MNWSSESESLVTKNTLVVLSLINYIHLNKKNIFILIGSESWIRSYKKDSKKTYVGISTDLLMKDSEKLICFTYENIQYIASQLVLESNNAVKGISKIDNYIEDNDVKIFVQKLKDFFNNDNAAYIPQGYEGVVLLSHDIDYLQTNLMYRLGRLYYLLNYLRFGKLLKFFFSIPHFLEQVFFKTNWLYEDVLEIEKIKDIRSTWFIFSHDKENRSLYNPKYNLSDKKLKAIIKKIKNNKSEIGLHSSPESSTNLELLLKEKKNLEKIIGGEIYGNRHHMGRFTSGVSYDIWINSKFAYDASFLSNDLSIDISSSKHFFNLYKSNGDESIIEFPTEWMDVQFLNAQAVNKEKFKVELIKKLEQVKENKQVISLNWHCMPYDWYLQTYEEILDYCINSNIYVGSYEDYMNEINY